MSKALFLKHFQNNLMVSLEELIKNGWFYKNLEILSEDSNLCGQFHGIVDLSIRNEQKPNSIVAIEIEHISSYRQALRNIRKLKNWAHLSNYRKCSLLQVFNEDCDFNLDQIGELIRSAKEHQKKALGFYYDFVFYKADDFRKTRSTAENLVFSADFQTRIWALMEDADII